MIVIICEICGKEKILSRRHNVKGRDKFCSYRCAGIRRSENAKKLSSQVIRERKEKIKEYQKKYRLEHQQEEKERCKQYRLNHTEEVRQQKRQWGKENSEHVKQERKQWKENNPDKLKQSRKQYKDKKRGFGSVLLNNWQEGYDGHHIDTKHIIYMPKEIHQNIPHSVLKDINMGEINKLAFLYLPETNLWQEKKGQSGVVG